MRVEGERDDLVEYLTKGKDFCDSISFHEDKLLNSAKYDVVIHKGSCCEVVMSWREGVGGGGVKGGGD